MSARQRVGRTARASLYGLGEGLTEFDQRQVLAHLLGKLGASVPDVTWNLAVSTAAEYARELRARRALGVSRSQAVGDGR